MSKTVAEKMLQGREYRKVYEVRAADDENYMVEGYATVFNTPYTLYDDGQYRLDEQVDPNAFANTDMADVIMQYDHEGRVFARISNGTLNVEPDETGLKIRAYLGGTTIGKQLYEEIKGGYTTKMSFGFTVDGQERIEEEDGDEIRILRIIRSVRKLFDVSAVSLPANDATSISARSYLDGVIEELALEKRKAEEKRRRELDLKLRLMKE